jgi:hypothetical protein
MNQTQHQDQPKMSSSTPRYLTVHVPVLVHYATELDFESFAEQFGPTQKDGESEEMWWKRTRKVWDALLKEHGDHIDLDEIDEEEVHEEDIDPLDCYTDAREAFESLVEKAEEQVKDEAEDLIETAFTTRLDDVMDGLISRLVCLGLEEEEAVKKIADEFVARNKKH